MKKILGTHFWIVVSVIFLLLASVVTYTFVSFYQTSKSYIESLGEETLVAQTVRAQIQTKLVPLAVICFVIFAVIAGYIAYAYRRTILYQKEISESREELNRLNDVIIKALAYAIDAKDRYTSGHSQRVAKYSVELAKRMGKTEEEQNVIYHSALLHDVGKIRVPEALINKPGKLTDEEFRQIIPHPICSYHILKNIYSSNDISFGAKFHHERYDGTGYPNGLSGENIPEIARIIGVADAYDAMASNRSYRKALPQEVVKAEIEKGKGKQFDPAIADVMLQMIAEDTNYELCQAEAPRHTILILDDDEMALVVAKRILQTEDGYDILTSLTFDEAMARLRERKVDLILLDLMLPEIDGFEAFSRIRAEYNIPIVFMTGDNTLESIERAADIGAEDFLVKPILPIAMKETVHAILSNWS